MRVFPAFTRVLTAVLMFAALAVPWALRAQERKEGSEPAFYKVEISISDAADTSSKAGRRYTMLVDSGGKATMRVGNRIPYVTATAPNPQYQYLDAGVNLDCRLRESSGKVILNLDMDLSNAVAPVATQAGSAPNPTIASTRMMVSAILAPGKSTQIAAIDDPASRRKLNIEALLTKLN